MRGAEPSRAELSKRVAPRPRGRRNGRTRSLDGRSHDDVFLGLAAASARFPPSPSSLRRVCRLSPPGCSFVLSRAQPRTLARLRLPAMDVDRSGAAEHLLRTRATKRNPVGKSSIGDRRYPGASTSGTYFGKEESTLGDADARGGAKKVFAGREKEGEEARGAIDSRRARAGVASPPGAGEGGPARRSERRWRSGGVSSTPARRVAPATRRRRLRALDGRAASPAAPAPSALGRLALTPFVHTRARVVEKQRVARRDGSI